MSSIKGGWTQISGLTISGIIPSTHDATRCYRYRHELGSHDRRAGARRPVVRGHRSRKRDGPAGRRRPRRQEADARGDDLGAAGAVEIRAPRPSHQVDEILAAATSATREAENGGEFLAAIERTTGIRPRIITGTEEARLIHMAAVYGVDTPKTTVVIDIGGGSVEITRGVGTRRAVRAQLQARRHPPDRALRDLRPAERTRRAQDGQAHLASRSITTCERIVAAGFDRVIGTSGTILSVGTVATAIDRGAVPAETRNLRVPAKSIRRLRKLVTELDLEERLQLPGLDPRRADLTVAGAVLSTRCCARSTRTRSRCAISRCAKGWCSTTSAGIVRTSHASIAIPMSAAARHRARRALQLGSGALAQVAKLALALFDDAVAFTGSASANASGSSSRRCFTTSAITSATRSTIAIRTT